MPTDKQTCLWTDRQARNSRSNAGQIGIRIQHTCHHGSRRSHTWSVLHGKYFDNEHLMIVRNISLLYLLNSGGITSLMTPHVCPLVIWLVGRNFQKRAGSYTSMLLQEHLFIVILVYHAPNADDVSGLNQDIRAEVNYRVASALFKFFVCFRNRYDWQHCREHILLYAIIIFHFEDKKVIISLMNFSQKAPTSCLFKLY